MNKTKETNCRATEERLLKEIQLASWKEILGNNEVALREQLYQHRRTKKAVYEDVKEMINNLLAKGLNGKRYNFMINGEELKDIILGDSE